jgi:uncharacterized BrkB/YihY/UPF0761 family membrane protein
MTLKDLWELLTETWNAWSTHKAPRSGAALAYHTTFSLAPLLMIVIVVFPILWFIKALNMIDFVVSLGVSTVLFAMLYRFLPDTEVPWRDVWIGLGITASSAGGG